MKFATDEFADGFDVAGGCFADGESASDSADECEWGEFVDFRDGEGRNADGFGEVGLKEFELCGGNGCDVEAVGFPEVLFVFLGKVEAWELF